MTVTVALPSQVVAQVAGANALVTVKGAGSAMMKVTVVSQLLLSATRTL